MIFFAVLTPLVLLLAIVKLFPKCVDFKHQIWKSNRFIICTLLILNMIEALLLMCNFIAPKRKGYCEFSVLLNLFVFDNASLLTV